MAAGLSLIIAAGALQYLMARPTIAVPPRLSQDWTSAPAAPAQDYLADETAEPEPSRLYSAASEPAAEGPMGVDEFLGLMERRVPKPVAAWVAGEFKKDKKLSAAWKLYKKTRGGKAPAKEFVDFITRIPQFRQLMTKFQSDPGFKQALAGVVSHKELAAVVRGALRELPGGQTAAGRKGGAAARGGGKSGQALAGGRTPAGFQPGAGGQSGPGGSGWVGSGSGQAVSDQDVAAIKREWEAMAKSGLALPDYKSAGAGPLPQARAMTPARTFGPQDVASGPPAGGGGPAQSAAGELTGEGTRDTQALDKGWQARAVDDKGKEQFEADRRFMTLLMKRLSDDERRGIEAAMCANPANVPCNPTTDHDIWGACWASGLFERCKTLCADVEGCEAESGEKLSSTFAACRAGDARRPEECIVACKDGAHGYACSGSDIDQAEWTKACLAKSVPDPSYCSDKMLFGPCSDPTGVDCERGTWAGDADLLTADARRQLEALCGEGELYRNPQCEDIIRAALATNACILSVNAAKPACRQQTQASRDRELAALTGATRGLNNSQSPPDPRLAAERGFWDSVRYGWGAGNQIGREMTGHTPVLSTVGGWWIGVGGAIVEGGGAVKRSVGRWLRR